jgi:NAD(P)-dependent dehydrogenase (short-subunit alcohol dehydrogenase family)
MPTTQDRRVKSLEGKVALVTGAAVGLGREFARALANEGAKLAVCDVREEVHEVARSFGDATLAIRADVSKPADVLRVVEATLNALGRIDVLVNNAGVWGASLPTDDLDKTERDYATLIDTNLKGVFMFGRAVIPHMIAQRAGDIVNICTDHVQTCGAPWQLGHDDAPSCPWAGRPPRPTGGGPSMDLYDAGKWAQLGLTFAWSQALQTHGIRVNALCMGATDTQMLRSFHGFEPPAEEVARWMKAQDVAQLMVDLINDGRTGDYIGVAVGHPMVLPARRANPYFMAAQR